MFLQIIQSFIDQLNDLLHILFLATIALGPIVILGIAVVNTYKANLALTRNMARYFGSASRNIDKDTNRPD